MIYRNNCVGSKRTPCCHLKNDIASISRWAESNDVKYNGLKSAELLIGSTPSAAGSLSVGQDVVPNMKYHVHLGVTLSSNLCWDEHIKRMIGKVAGCVHLCRTLAFRHRLPPAVIRHFYTAFIRPRLEYCSAVWCGASPATLKLLEKVQVKVAKAIVQGKGHKTVTDLLTEARLPTLAWRRREHCLGLLWQLYRKQGPPKLQLILPAAVAARASQSLRASHSLRFPTISSRRHLSSFLCHNIPVWNKLPSSIVSCTTLFSFRSAVRSLFFSEMYTFGL